MNKKTALEKDGEQREGLRKRGEGAGQKLQKKGVIGAAGGGGQRGERVKSSQ